MVGYGRIVAASLLLVGVGSSAVISATAVSSSSQRPRPSLVQQAVAPKPVRATRAIMTSTTTSTTTSTSTTTTTVSPTGCAAIVVAISWPPGWRAECAASRPGVLGVTMPNGVTTLYVRPGESNTLLRAVAFHEAGHAWDFARLSPADVAIWCVQRGCDATRFFRGGESGNGWTAPLGAEDWASAWSACHGGGYNRSYLGLPAPGRALCALQDELVRRR